MVEGCAYFVNICSRNPLCLPLPLLFGFNDGDAAFGRIPSLFVCQMDRLFRNISGRQLETCIGPQLQIYILREHLPRPFR